jgi:tRNA/tmRNA/rRNA uracil-C5-methylase (TrmA/RlmC/RlmD family)
MSPDTQTTSTGLELVVDVGPVAHGGHCVARHEGRVVFVRHGIPGERVRVRLTDAEEKAKFWRADVVEVLEASPDRVPHFWRTADSASSWAHGRPPVGGAELGHVSLQRQRSLKAEVLAEQLMRLAAVGLSPDVEGSDKPQKRTVPEKRTTAGPALRGARAPASASPRAAGSACTPTAPTR